MEAPSRANFHRFGVFVNRSFDEKDEDMSLETNSDVVLSLMWLLFRNGVHYFWLTF